MSDSEVKDETVPKETKERRKIEIKFIQDKTRRHITFSKRKHGIMKKAYELSVLTGTQVLLLVVSETGLVYTFTTPKFQPIVTQAEGKNLIQACLNAPEEDDEDEDEEDDDEEDEEHNQEHDRGVNMNVNVAGQPHSHAGVPTSVQVPTGGPHGHLPQQPHQQQQNIQQQQQQHPHGVQQQQQGSEQTPNFTNASYLNPDHAAAYEQYFNGVNSQHGQF